MERQTESGQTADWWRWLAKDACLPPGLRESYRRTLEGFDQLSAGARKTAREGARAPRSKCH